MDKQPVFHVKKSTLLAVAGSVWLIAGINVARLGILSYLNVLPITFVNILLSIVVFSAFGFMFFKMSMKHSKRIQSYCEEFRPIWHFFDLKSYIIMAVMMSGGIWLRYSGLVPDIFIAVFYTGLGCALALAGVMFFIMFFRFKKNSNR